MDQIESKMKKCVIIGAGTYGQVYSEYLSDEYEVVGFIDDNQDLIGTNVQNIPVLGNSDYLFHHLDKSIAVFVPIGNNEIRVNLLRKLSDEGFIIPSFIHDTTIIHKSVRIGKAVYILPASNIMPSTVLEDFVMISMGVNIAHHVIIKEGCFFSQGSNVGASIYIGEKAYFGISSTVMTGVKNVGKSVLLGAGTVVIKDVQDHAVVIGNPGKILRINQ